MSESYHSLLVVFDKTKHEDDAQPIIDAIKQFRGVVDVVRNTADIDHSSSVALAKYRIGKRLFEALYEEE